MAEPHRHSHPTHAQPHAPAVPDHQLLHSIGQGSYGEVWLARNTLGRPRAVKVVRREHFRDPRPYEREFKGLQHFEPVSRGHEGLVDILHVGHHEAQGFFYYVMELADNAATPPAPTSPPSAAASYEPLTLESRLRSEGRLPATECLRLALHLAEALRFLHDRGLVHRDLKPSNIIFVEGTPKLADVGLVAQPDRAASFVGTEGFVPPEGPGTIQADLFSLGKCLYEMAMGKDRCAFPSPPTRLDELPDHSLLIELNEVILTACAPRPADRYPSAARLIADLQILRQGRSLRLARRHRLWRRALVWAAGGIALLALAAGLAPRFRPVTAPGLQVVREFALPGGWPANRAVLGDYDGCGLPELVTAADGHLAVVSLEGQLLIERRHPGFEGDVFSLSRVEDLDGDDRGEALVSWRTGTNLYVSVFNQDLNEVRRLHALGSLEQRAVGSHPSSHLQPVAFLPAAGPQPDQLIVQITSHYALWPRCLRAYDYHRQTLLWERPYAATPIHVRVHDLDGDGSPELLLGCYSPDNGARLPDGEEDSQTYLHVLSADGQRRWSHALGGVYMRCFVHPAPPSVGPFLYALVVRNEEAHRQSGGQLPTESRILKFDAAGTELARYESPLELAGVVLADLAGTGQSRLYTADSQGFLHVLDPHLRLEAKVRLLDNPYDWVRLAAKDAGDLDGDGQRELLLESSQVQFVSGTNPGRPAGEANFRRYHRHRLHVLNARLELRASLTLNELSKTQPGGPLEFLPPDARGRQRVVVLGQQVRMLEWRK